jgi:hypothetical protein
MVIMGTLPMTPGRFEMAAQELDFYARERSTELADLTVAN